jgi:ferredoxin
MEVVVDEDLCEGCGNCEEICPAVFHLNEVTGKAEENCPVEAITVKE